MEQKHLCQQTGQPGEESFKLGMTGDGEDDPQSSEKVVDWLGKQRVQRDVERRDLKMNKTGHKGVHPKCIHTNKEVPGGQYCGGRSHPFPGKSV